jgi:purine-nucleoside phosphorylase
MSPPLQENLRESLDFLRSFASTKPLIGLVLGSGLGSFADGLPESHSVTSSEIPYYPAPTVEGHKGRLVFGELSGVPLVAFQGRLHFYETNSLELVLYPIRVALGLGVRILIVTNAAGGIHPALEAGDLMLITDQLNLTGVDLSFIQDYMNGGKSFYDKELMEIAESVSLAKTLALRKGVYAGLKGPSYETAAEVQMVSRLGGDCVGMSTVLETSYARSQGARLLGISCITNKATGISPSPLSHEEVTGAARIAHEGFSSLLRGIIEEVSKKGLSYWAQK